MEITMAEKKETVLVPRLRFPGFYDYWDKPKLSERMDVFRGASPRPKGDPRYYGGNIPRLMIEDATRDGKYVFPKIDFLTVDGAAKSRLLKKGNVILSCSGTRVAIPTILGIDACIHDGWLSFRNFKDINIEYLYYVFVKFHEKMQETATKGGVFNNLTTSILRDLQFGFPKLLEQQKIASFLSAVDTKIQQLQRKKELLEQYKKGVMQQIFSQQIRFKPALSEVEGKDDGSYYPNWAVKQLGDVLTFISTNSFSRNDLNYEAGEIYNIHYGDIHTKFRSNFHLSNEEIPFINSNVSINKISDEQLCKSGDVVIADASEDYNDIGKTIEIINTNNQKLVAGLHTFLGRDFENSTVVGFKCYLFQTDYIRKQIMRIAQGISVLGISKKNLSKILFELPCKEEQQKIADFLSAIDDKIDKTVEQIERTQRFKKGLLQQMFV